MKRKQIEDIVRLFKFEKRDEDCYFLITPSAKIYLYYYKSKPKGWRVEFVGTDASSQIIRRVNQPIDILHHIEEYTRLQENYRCRDLFEKDIYDLYRQSSWKYNIKERE